MFDDDEKCKRCGKKISFSTWNWKNGRCEPCQKIVRSSIVMAGVLIVLVLASIVGYIGYIEYGYQLEKCSELDSSESNYDFDLTIEKNAEYNQDCYKLKNHPLVVFEYIGLPIILSIIFWGLFTFMIRMMV